MHAAVPVMSLWLPILLSAALVFVVSSIMHMVLTYHQGDFRKVPDEANVLEALRRFPIPPGDYMLPRGEGMASMKDPAFIEKLQKGPVLLATFLKPGPPNMGPNLLKWFLYCIVVSLFAGYVAGVTLGPGTAYMSIFRVVGTVAFVGYALAYWQNAIWYGRSVSTTWKVTFDGLIYGLVTAGTFGWLWPKG
jgi:hypothetical protein